MEEEWYAVNGFSEFEITKSGVVRRKANKWVLTPKFHGRKKEYAYVTFCVNGNRYPKDVHRLLAETFIPNPENKPFVDHIDRNALNNCLTNLRWATCNENNLNIGMKKNNTSGYRGVSFDKRSKKWKAFYGSNPKVHLGSFNSAEEASEAFKEYIEKQGIQIKGKLSIHEN